MRLTIQRRKHHIQPKRKHNIQQTTPIEEIKECNKKPILLLYKIKLLQQIQQNKTPQKQRPQYNETQSDALGLEDG